MIRSKVVAAFVGITLIAALIALATWIVIIPQTQLSNGPPVVSKTTCDRQAGFMLIIADLSGFNGSIHHGAPANPWPVIQIHRGDVVRLLVCSQDQTQPHGFAIATYLEPGVVLAPGDAYSIVFTANQAGAFRIYCDVFCTIHVFMVGRLIVAP